METLQVAGTIAFIYGALWASSTLKDARRALENRYLEPLRGIERLSILNALGPVLPLIVALGIVSFWQHFATGIAAAAILLTVTLSVMRGEAHGRKMRGAGVPEAYVASYRRAHVIRAVALAFCAATLLKPLVF
jgi:hypothetical protein